MTGRFQLKCHYQPFDGCYLETCVEKDSDAISKPMGETVSAVGKEFWNSDVLAILALACILNSTYWGLNDKNKFCTTVGTGYRKYEWNIKKC